MPRAFAYLFTAVALAAGCDAGTGGAAGPGDGGVTDAAPATDAPGADRPAAGDDGARPDDGQAPPPDAAPADGLPDASGADASGPDGGPDETEGCVEGDFQPYFGNFHAHTANSDGTGTPAEAFAYARDTAQLDILVLTDHLESMALSPGTWADCTSAAAAATSAAFLADCGFEYSAGFTLALASTGHNNVFFAPGLFPAPQVDFHAFYASLVACAECVGQFNHPGYDTGINWNNFEYHADVDTRMRLIEFNTSSDPFGQMFAALGQGWHVAPVIDQDNHEADWGTKNETRTGVYLSALTRPALRSAMRARRTFMTRDSNAIIKMMAGTCWMGSILDGRAGSNAVTVEVSDPDAAGTFARIELFGPAQAPLGTHDCAGATSCTADFTVDVTTPTYVVARAVRTTARYLVAAPIWFRP